MTHTNEPKCECRIEYSPGSPIADKIIQCQLCKSAPELLEALKRLDGFGPDATSLNLTRTAIAHAEGK